MIRSLKCLLLVFLSLMTPVLAMAQGSQQAEASQLFHRLRDKLMSVKDYVADVQMQVDISFMRIPRLEGRLYFKSPNKLKLERQGGLAILPKKNMSISLTNLIPEGDITVIDAGEDVINGKKIRVLKVIPDDDRNDIVLAKIWVDEARLLALRTETTTRNNGTVKMELSYGRYMQYGLPDKMTMHMDVKEYKLPQSVTMDYDGNTETEATKQARKARGNKGSIHITYLRYSINQGLSDAIFADKKP
jgi:outer membrane lipoprotein-sorting protein